VEITFKEPHLYNQDQSFYRLQNKDKMKYDIVLVEGFSGDIFTTFTNGIDYKQVNDGIMWLSGGSIPDTIPLTLSSISHRPFEVTYVYENPVYRAMLLSLYPFIKEDGRLMAIMNACGSQIIRLFDSMNGIVHNRDIRYVKGDAIDHIATWFGLIRLSDESDDNFRGRVQEYLGSYVSAGTITSIQDAVEAYTGIEPTILELWESVSYYDYNQDDYDNQLPPDQYRTYLYEGGEPDGVLTFQAYYYDELFQLNTFYCILPYSVIIDIGIDNIKDVLNAVKAAGIQAYLGWLIEDDFADPLMSNWTVVQ